MYSYESGLSNNVEQRQSVTAPVDFNQMKMSIVRGKSSLLKSSKGEVRWTNTFMTCV